MKKIVFLIIFLMIFAFPFTELDAEEVKELHTFEAGDVIRASQVNENFTILKKAIERLEGLLQERIAEIEAKDRVLKRLEEENQSLKKDIAELKAGIQTLLKETSEQLDRLLQEKKAEVEAKNRSLYLLEEENRVLKEGIEKLKASMKTLEGQRQILTKAESQVSPELTEEVSPEVPESGSKVWTDPITGMEFVWVPEGCFQMGCVSEVGCKHDEKPVHKVCLNGFWMGKYEVTQAQWQQVMGKNPSNFNKDKIGQVTSNYPVEKVSWNDVQKFLRKLNEEASNPPLPLPGGEFRLPTEAEWEYAARAGTETAYSFGNDAGSLDEYAWYTSNSDGKTHPVGQLKPNAWGLYDMHGNVGEWCADPWHDNYKSAPADGSIWEAGGDTSRRLLRGGSWFNSPESCRTAYRYRYNSDGSSYNIGFRVVVSGSRSLP